MGNIRSIQDAPDTIRRVFQAQASGSTGTCCCNCGQCACNSKDQSKQSTGITVYCTNQAASDQRANR